VNAAFADVKQQVNTSLRTHLATDQMMR